MNKNKTRDSQCSLISTPPSDQCPDGSQKAAAAPPQLLSLSMKLYVTGHNFGQFVLLCLFCPLPLLGLPHLLAGRAE